LDGPDRQQQQYSSDLDEGADGKGKGITRADLLHHLAEREAWKKERDGYAEETKRLQRMADCNMELALRLKARLLLERKRAAFFLERLDQVTHRVLSSLSPAEHDLDASLLLS